MKHWKRFLLAGLVLCCFALALFGVVPQLLQLQVVPAFVRAITLMSVGALAIVGLLILATLLFGRFYCSLLCPLGLLQDLIARITGRRSHAPRRGNWVRYLLTGLVLGMFATGWVWGLLLLDPYSTAGRIATGASLMGWGGLVALVLLSVWRKRFFCATLCPVGTVLGLLSKRSLYRLAIGDTCVKCKQCATVCPSGAIDLTTGTLDNERCVRCLACLNACPRGAITLRRGKVPTAPQRARRDFLTHGALLVAGFGAGVALTKAARPAIDSKLLPPPTILPPGAGNANRFAAKCTGCQACLHACPTGILVPTHGGLAPVGIDLSRGSCDFTCNACGQACPTGAIQPLALAAKQTVQIAVAKLDAKKCKVFQDEEPCGKCAEVCPTHAITLRKTGAPRPVKPAHCLGCGKCVEVCPSAHGKALSILPVPEQSSVTPDTKAAIQAARHKIIAGTAECILIPAIGPMVVRSGRGVSPLLWMYDNHREAMKGATICDKVIGRATAAIAICGGIRHLHSELMSEDAINLLRAHNVEATATTIVPLILNRKRDGRCPMELAVDGIDDPHKAVEAVRATLKNLQN